MTTQITLPRDAEGREIPLDTDVLYDKDGNVIEVSRYQYYPKVGPGYWNLKSVRNKYYRQDEVHLIPPDSWERLERDATLTPRDYIHARGIKERKDGRVATMTRDLVIRANALAKAGEGHGDY